MINEIKQNLSDIEATIFRLQNDSEYCKDDYLYWLLDDIAKNVQNIETILYYQLKV